MSTRAIIKFSDDSDTYYIDRTHDGFPEEILPDIEATIYMTRNKWSNPELEQLVAWFIMLCNDLEKRLADYAPISGYPGDECYRYFVKWDDKKQKWDYGMEDAE